MLTAVAAANALAGCGGGSDDPVAPAPAATTTTLATTVIDGPLANALVCLDRNDNGACDAGEPSARSGADGRATLTVDNADVGKYPLLALVGTDAVDAATGAVRTAYAMRAPADRSAVVSPLTTLVAAQSLADGSSSADAEKALQALAGTTLAFTTDYTKGSDAASVIAAAAARVLVLMKQQSNADPAWAAAIVGQIDANGTKVAAADVDRLLDEQIRQMLPQIAASVTDGAVTGAADAVAREKALQAAGATLLAAAPVLTPAAAVLLIGNAKKPDAPATVTAAPAAGLITGWFTYAGAGDWYLRYFTSTALQSTPDANGYTRFVDNRKRAVGGTVQVWGETDAYTRTDAYFDGTAWNLCPTNFENRSSGRDAEGRATSVYCLGYLSSSRRSASDIAGRRMADVVTSIRAYPLLSTQGSFASWGPDPALLGDAVFPAGSTLYYQTSTQTANPDGYATAASNTVRTWSAEIVAGGTSAACNGTSAQLAATMRELGSLEDLIAANPGTPCVYATGGAAGERNEWGSQSSASLGVVEGPVSANAYYRAGRNLRVAFTGSGNVVRYLSCAIRASDGSSRNCDPIGTGTYTVATAGDARVLRFVGLPAATLPLSYERLYVERGGKVYYGYHDKLRVDNTVRLNGPAIDALLARLGISR